MRRISTIIGFMTLAVVPGHPMDSRPSRPPAGHRAALPRIATRAADARTNAGADAGAVTGTLVPVAIDSETGERCCVSARQAGLLQPEDDGRGA